METLTKYAKMKRNFTFSVVCNYSFFSATILCLTNNWKIKTISLDGLVWTCTMSCQINKLSREKGGYPAENTFFERVEKIMLEEAAVCRVVCVCALHTVECDHDISPSVKYLVPSQNKQGS